eukprot:g241.t1
MANPHDEFKELQRKFQYLEQNRKDYVKESGLTIARQQKILGKLKKDNEYLKDQYRLLVRKPKNLSHHSRLVELHEQVDTYASKVALEKKSAGELSKHIRLMKRKLLQVRKDIGGINAAKERHRLTQKQITILENRLDKSLVKFNNALAENKDLRGKIDNLRKERVVFDEIYQKLSAELNEKKRLMAEIIETSNQSYEARDRAHSEIRAIEQQNEMEQRKHNDNILELDRLHEEIRTRRSNGESLKDVIDTTDNGEDISEGKNGHESEESSLRQKLANVSRMVRNEKKALADAQEKIETFEIASEEIRKKTGITDIDEFAKNFILKEEQHFSLFNYVNGQTQEIEKLESDLAKLKVEERKHTAAEGMDEDHTLLLQRQLQESVSSKTASSKLYEEKYAGSSKTLVSLKIGVQNMFEKSGCDEKTIAEILHIEKPRVSDANVMQFLGMIEQRANELLQLCALSHVHETGAAVEDRTTTEAIMKVIGRGPSHPLGEQKIQISLPGMGDYSDGEESDDDQVEIPQDLDQIKKEVMAFMAERASSGGIGDKNKDRRLGT